MATFGCEMELFPFNEPPIAVWFSGAFIKFVIEIVSQRERESRLIRKPKVEKNIPLDVHAQASY